MISCVVVKLQGKMAQFRMFKFIWEVKIWVVVSVVSLTLGTLAHSRPQRPRLLVSTKNSDLWPGPTTEVRDSRTSRHSAHTQSQVWQIWLDLVSICCVYKSIQDHNVVGPGQRSRFLVLTKRSAASGDENDTGLPWYGQQFPCILCVAPAKRLLSSCAFIMCMISL